jgi:hypothetical protein
MESYQGLSVFIQIITFLGAIIIFFRGFEEYRKSNKTKRAEFLEKLIQEFNSPSLEVAKAVLEDFAYPEWLEESEKKYGEYENLPSMKIEETLRYHKGNGVEDDDELAIRESFDVFLDFLAKLSYYSKNELINEDELYYFSYYFRRMEKPPYAQALSNYIDFYFNREDFDLLGIKLPLPRVPTLPSKV